MPDPQHNPTYWRSLDELADTPRFRAFLEAEFPVEDDPGRLSRRRWLQLMGASLALAGAGACRWEKENIVPLAARPEDRVPGKPYKIATAMELGGSAIRLLVTCVDGRPIKIEGNPQKTKDDPRRPPNLGATNAYAQAAILELYDPDRSQRVVQQSGGQEVPSTWEQFEEFAGKHFTALEEKGGEGLAVLADPSTSLTWERLRHRLRGRFPYIRWVEYEPISWDEWPYRAIFDLDDAEVIVCLDADILRSHPDSVRLAGEFAARRSPDAGRMNRLYVVESTLSTTGAVADHRLAMKSSDIASFVSDMRNVLPGERVPQSADRRAQFLQAVTNDLVAHRGRGVVVAGRRQPPAVHAAVADMNVALENFIGYHQTVWSSFSRPAALRQLVEDMNAGKVTTLLAFGGNPVYNAPADLEFATALDKVETTVHVGLYRNETGRRCTWHLPQAHFLESWGDARAWDGAFSLVQPTIKPLYGGRTRGEVLAILSGNPGESAYDQVREAFSEFDELLAALSENTGIDNRERHWRKTLHDGVLAESHWPQLAFADSDVELLPGATPESELEIVFCEDASLYDGRFANNGWLQEAPDPMTRLAWDNAAVMSPATAKKLGVENEEVVKLKYKGREVEIPALVMPGQADGSVAVALGYGRTAAGHVGGSEADGVPPVGVDVYPLRTSDAMSFGTGLTVEPTGRKVRLACTQDHFAIDLVGLRARGHRVGELIREDTLEHYNEHPDFAKHTVHHPPLKSLWEEHEYEGRRWAMAIDLSKCIGCGACVVACQAENNVPIVGRERVLEGREMHWLRVDRYFAGEPDDPNWPDDPNRVRAVVQPVACQQCELAPCEQVCPVGATTHSSEGLNDMVYNRCIGTRYCANNCPWKVRRFNFFNYHKNLGDPAEEVAKMKFNPEVTVRSRGVMEKCTYCVQRIQAAKIEAKRKSRPIPRDEIRTACQQTCPTGAIVFGDLSDPDSAVSTAQADPRSYVMLAELNDKPRTAYLARIRNPNPAMEKVKKKEEEENRREPR